MHKLTKIETFSKVEKIKLATNLPAGRRDHQNTKQHKTLINNILNL